MGVQIIVISLGMVPSWLNLPHSRFQSLGSATQFKRYVNNSLALMVFAAIVTTISRLPRPVPRPYKAGEHLITAGIWTVHFGIDNEGRDSQYRMRDLIG